LGGVATGVLVNNGLGATGLLANGLGNGLATGWADGLAEGFADGLAGVGVGVAAERFILPFFLTKLNLSITEKTHTDR